MTTTRLAPAAFLAGFLFVLAAPGADSAQDSSAPDPNGRPKAFKAGKAAVVALYYDTDEWYLELTAKNKTTGVFTGTVRYDKGKMWGKFDGLEKNKKNGLNDWIFPHPDESGFDFKFTNVGKVDQLRFKGAPAATTMTVTVKIDGAASPDRVLIGKGGAHPKEIPFTLPAHPGK